MRLWTRWRGWIWAMVVSGLLAGCAAPAGPATPVPLPTPTFDLGNNRYPNPPPAPVVQMTAFSAEAVHPLNPGTFAYQIGGRYLSDAQFEVSQPLPDGRDALIYREPLPGAPWPDGVVAGQIVWDGAVWVVADQPVVPGRDAAGRVVVSGMVVWADGRSTPGEALFDADDGTLLAWQLDGADRAPTDGDTFAPELHVVGSDGVTRGVAGTALPINSLQLMQQSLPPGTVRAGFSAETATGTTARVSRDVVIGTDAGAIDILVFDPDRQFQFQLPGDWPQPVSADGMLSATHNATRLQVQLIESPPHSELTATVMNGWEGVSVLYEDAVTVAGEPAERTFYGYVDVAGGEHVGVLLTFFMGETGVLVDIDGPENAQTETITVLDRIAATWRQRPLEPAPQEPVWTNQDGRWLPTGFEQVVTETGWTRYARPDGGVAFFAQRAGAASGSSEPVLLTQWQRSAADGHPAFVAGEPQRVAFDGQPWLRLSFVADEATQGSLWVRVDDSAETVLWIEAPSSQFAAFEEVALVTLAANR